MPTTVPTKGDLDKVLVRLAAIEATLKDILAALSGEDA